MSLTPENMHLLHTGKKCREIRLYDEKRQKIHVDDEILFQNLHNERDVFIGVVKDLTVCDSFFELFRIISLEEAGWPSNTLPEVAAQDMRKYYSLEQEKVFGVVAITLYEKSSFNQ